MNTTARTTRSTAAVAGGALLLAALAAALAPAATAAPADSEPPQLAVSTAAPAEIGLAGQPVAFTTTVHNTGAFDTSSARLIYLLDGGDGLDANAVALEYRLGGTAWKKVPLTFTGGKFRGEMPETFPLAAGASRTVQLRLGLPMGTPHHGDGNGGTQRLKLTTMVSYGAAGAATDTDEDTVAVDGLSASLSGVPHTATAGGPAVSFAATVRNPTASAYENVTDVLFTDRHTSVQVLRGGTWTTLAPVTAAAEPDVYGFDIVGKDASLAPHSTTRVTVRLSYRKDAPAGKTSVNPCVFVNQGSVPFTGTTSCGASASLTVRAAGSGTATPTPSATPSATASATATASAVPSASATTSGAATSGAATSGAVTAGTSGTTTAGTGTQLAHTGSAGASAAAATGAALLVIGGGAVGFVALRRRRTTA